MNSQVILKLRWFQFFYENATLSAVSIVTKWYNGEHMIGVNIYRIMETAPISIFIVQWDMTACSQLVNLDVLILGMFRSLKGMWI